jgi:hypothetical protein
MPISVADAIDAHTPGSVGLLDPGDDVARQVGLPRHVKAEAGLRQAAGDPAADLARHLFRPGAGGRLADGPGDFARQGRFDAGKVDSTGSRRRIAGRSRGLEADGGPRRPAGLEPVMGRRQGAMRADQHGEAGGGQQAMQQFHRISPDGAVSNRLHCRHEMPRNG